MSRKWTALDEVVDAVLFALDRVRVGVMAIALILAVKIVGIFAFPTQAPLAAPNPAGIEAVAAIR